MRIINPAPLASRIKQNRHVGHEPLTAFVLECESDFISRDFHICLCEHHMQAEPGAAAQMKFIRVPPLFFTRESRWAVAHAGECDVRIGAGALLSTAFITLSVPGIGRIFGQALSMPIW